MSLFDPSAALLAAVRISPSYLDTVLQSWFPTLVFTVPALRPHTPIRLPVIGNSGQQRDPNCSSLFYHLSAAADMACLHLARSGFLPMIHPRSGFLQRHRSHALCLPVHCCLQEEVGDNGEERPESLFTKELKRRGMKDAETASYSVPGQEDMESKAENGGDRQWTKRNGVASAEYEKDATGQRERSIALNSVGIEGLVPRAKLLLTLGGTFFLGFWPLILITFFAFVALYWYFGSGFVHDASKTPVTLVPYVDPYELLEDERISQIARNVE